MIDSVAALLGMSSVSLLHSLLPTHWLPFSVVGRSHGWSLTKTLLVSACSPPATPPSHLLQRVAGRKPSH